MSKYAVSFNQDKTCIAVSFKEGFTIYNVDPFQEMFHRSFVADEISFVEMLYRSNILAIVTRGSDKARPNNQLMIWDDHANLSIKDITFKSTVLSVRLSKEMIVAVVESAVYIYDFRTFNLLQSIDTVENKLGLITLAPNAPKRIIGCLGSVPGQVRILVGAPLNTTSVTGSERSDRSPPSTPVTKVMAATLIQAHSSSLAAMSLNFDGSLLATSSFKGTLVRVYSAETSILLHELRRGADQVLIYCITFRRDSSYVACTSDRGTCHVFSLTSSNVAGSSSPGEGSSRELAESNTQPRPRIGTETSGGLGMMGVGSLTSAVAGGIGSIFSGVREVLPKFITAQRSFAQFRIPDCTAKNVASFCSDDATIAIACTDGRYFRASYAGGGECAVIQNKKFAETWTSQMPAS